MSPMQVGAREERRKAKARVPKLVLFPQAAKARANAQAAVQLSSPCRIALVGFGTVGSAVARLLQSRDDRSLRLTHVCNRNVARKRVDWAAPEIVWTDSMKQVLASDADVIVELMGGLDPAHDLVCRALSSGKSVVTANKQLIAHSGHELLQLARSHGQYLGFGACVAGGVPVLSGLQDGLAGDRLLQIRGILNGTCNFILSRIEHAGSFFEDALREAQQAGFAEADPSFDLDGQDAGAKLAILARFGLKVNVAPDQVLCRSIRDVSAVDFEYARELNCTIRQISLAHLRDGKVYLAVGPSLVSKNSPLAKVSGSQNLVVSTGEFGGETSFGGHGAGGDPTAVAVLSDLVQAAKHRHHRVVAPECLPVADCSPMQDFESPQYVRFVVRDRPGIIASLAAVFARHLLNIDSILQKPGYEKSALPFAITLEACGQQSLAAALSEIAKHDFLVEPPLAMPVMQ